MSWTTTRDRTPDRRRDTPRRVSGGIKLRAGATRADHPLTAGWIDLLEASLATEPLDEGRQYAVSGQTISLEPSEGRIDAKIQGRSAKPYETSMRFEPIDSHLWDRLIEEMAGEAIYVAKLLDGVLPEQTEELFRSCGAELLPQRWDQVTISCSCTEGAGCKHAAALAYLLGDRLETQPLTMFTLRGCDASHLIDRLVQARAIRTHGVAAAHFDPFIPESQHPVLPLEACLDEYWRGGAMRSRGEKPSSGSRVQHALLRRLGPSPLKGRFPMVGLLASIYDAVAASMTGLRDRSER